MYCTESFKKINTYSERQELQKVVLIVSKWMTKTSSRNSIFANAD